MKHIKNVESTVRPEQRKILSDKVILAENIWEKQRQLIRYPESNEAQTMYVYDIFEYSKDEYIAYFSERDRSDIDYIAMMTDVDLEEV